jgi:hypothetical protein
MYEVGRSLKGISKASFPYSDWPSPLFFFLLSCYFVIEGMGYFCLYCLADENAFDS